MKEIRKIISFYDSLDHELEKVALATVVNVEGSAYRRIGARMLVTSSGSWVGGISGGCLEGDALKKAQKAIYQNNCSTVVYDTTDDDEYQVGVGLGCNGRIEILFSPIDPTDPHDIEQLRRITTSEEASLFVRIIGGDLPDLLGVSKQVVEEGLSDFAGVSADAWHQCVELVKKKRKPRVFELLTVKEQTIQVLLEYIPPEIRLIIVGDNYDILALIGIAQELGWEIYVVGKAKKLAKEVFQIATQVVDYKETHTLPLNAYTVVVLMSHDYEKDKQMLTLFMAKPLRYIGLLGPKKRMLKMQTTLGGKQCLEQMTNLYSPVGLEIGAESPEEIALSICSEIISVFREKTGGSLKFKEGSIHERVL